jgi:hypothetical protein
MIGGKTLLMLLDSRVPLHSRLLPYIVLTSDLAADFDVISFSKKSKNKGSGEAAEYPNRSQWAMQADLPRIPTGL